MCCTVSAFIFQNFFHCPRMNMLCLQEIVVTNLLLIPFSRLFHCLKSHVVWLVLSFSRLPSLSQDKCVISAENSNDKYSVSFFIFKTAFIVPGQMQWTAVSAGHDSNSVTVNPLMLKFCFYLYGVLYCDTVTHVICVCVAYLSLDNAHILLCNCCKKPACR